MVLPMSMVPIKEEGFSRNLDKILPDMMPCLLCSSICSLLEDMNAISVPEKKAEKSKETVIYIK